MRGTVCDLLIACHGFSYSVTGNEPLDRIRNLFSLKFAISEKAFANSHESFLEMEVCVHVELHYLSSLKVILSSAIE